MTPEEALVRVSEANDLIRSAHADGDPRINTLISKAHRLLYEAEGRLTNLIEGNRA